MKYDTQQREELPHTIVEQHRGYNTDDDVNQKHLSLASCFLRLCVRASPFELAH